MIHPEDVWKGYSLGLNAKTPRHKELIMRRLSLCLRVFAFFILTDCTTPVYFAT